MTWIKEQVHFEQEALEATLLDYVHEVDHMAERIQLLDKAIEEAIEKAPPVMRAVVGALPRELNSSKPESANGCRSSLNRRSETRNGLAFPIRNLHSPAKTCILSETFS